MSGDLVLITGATGHVGFRVLQMTLEAGYKVRAAVRSDAKARMLLSHPTLEGPSKEAQLSCVIVPDIVAPAAYDEALQDVKYAIHVASPLPDMTGAEQDQQDYQADLIRPAVKGTMNILESAKKSSTVQRILITSSIAALAKYSDIGNPDVLITPESRVDEVPTGPYESSMEAYNASKIASLNSAEAWVKEQKPHFDVIYVHPTFVQGRNDMATSTKQYQIAGSNMFAVLIALGYVTAETPPNAIVVCSLDDVARVHVESLNPKIAGNQSFVVSNPTNEGLQWNDVKDVVSKHFPEAIESGVLPNNGHLSSIDMNIDASRTERVFGFKHASFESQVVSIISHYLELHEKEQETIAK